MEFKQALGAIKQEISQGDLDQAYEQLVGLLDTFSDYAELADIARINQADLYQLKAQTLKGTISSEEARLAANQLADKALQIIRQLETGKVRFEEEIKPGSRKAWRYYVAGGIVTLAAAAVLWFLLGNPEEKPEECPVFSKTAELKVMILPFKQTGREKESDPAFDIMDGLNDLIEKTPGMRIRAIADVNEHYDIDKDYPNSAQAVEIAKHCGAQMLVWGKVRQSSRKDYVLDVRYRLLDAGGVRYAGDTTISRLLTMTQEASWTNDVQAINNLLYMVLANQMRLPIAANILEKISTPPATASNADSIPPVDTTTNFILADYHLMKNEPEKAIAIYDKVLTYYPENTTALIKRGALHLQKEDYSAAAHDLEAAANPSDKITAEAVQKARIDALLGSGQPEKAKKEVESAKKNRLLDNSWLDKKSREVQDSTVALQARRDVLERKANTRVADLNTRLEAAKANFGLGENEDALRYARDVLKADPKNVEAVKIAVETQLQNGDTANANKTLKSAERAGVNVKTIRSEPIRKLILPEKKQ